LNNNDDYDDNNNNNHNDNNQIVKLTSNTVSVITSMHVQLSVLPTNFNKERGRNVKVWLCNMKLSSTLPNDLISGITTSYITSDLLWLDHVVTLASNYHPMTRSANAPYQHSHLALMALPWRRRLAMADR